MNPAIALACTLSFTAPAYEPDLRDSTNVAACWDSSRFSIPEDPLRAAVFGWGINDRAIAYRDTFPVTPGAWTQLIVPWDRVTPWTYCVRLLDPSGNANPCTACVALGVWPVGVDPPPPAPAATTRQAIMHAQEWHTRPGGTDWFDLSGRRLRGPPESYGVYFERWRDERAPAWKFVVLER